MLLIRRSSLACILAAVFGLALTLLGAYLDTPWAFVLGTAFMATSPLWSHIPSIESSRSGYFLTVYDVFCLLTGAYLVGVPTVFAVAPWFKLPIVYDVMGTFLLPGALFSGQIIGALFLFTVALCSAWLKISSPWPWRRQSLTTCSSALREMDSNWLFSRNLTTYLCLAGWGVLVMGILIFSPYRYLQGYRAELSFTSVGWTIIAFADVIQMFALALYTFQRSSTSSSNKNSRLVIAFFAVYALIRMLNGARFFLIGALLSALAVLALRPPFGIAINFRNIASIFAIIIIGLSVLLLRGSFSADASPWLVIASAALTEPVFSTISYYNLAALELNNKVTHYGITGVIFDFISSLTPRFILPNKVNGIAYSESLTATTLSVPDIGPSYGTPFLIGELIFTFGISGGITFLLFCTALIYATRAIIWGQLANRITLRILAFWLWIIVFGWTLINAMRQPVYIWLKVIAQYGIIFPFVALILTPILLKISSKRLAEAERHSS